MFLYDIAKGHKNGEEKKRQEEKNGEEVQVKEGQRQKGYVVNSRCEYAQEAFPQQPDGYDSQEAATQRWYGQEKSIEDGIKEVKEIPEENRQGLRKVTIYWKIEFILLQGDNSAILLGVEQLKEKVYQQASRKRKL